jgi:hypothetical protein
LFFFGFPDGGPGLPTREEVCLLQTRPARSSRGGPGRSFIDAEVFWTATPTPGRQIRG